VVGGETLTLIGGGGGGGGDTGLPPVTPQPRVPAPAARTTQIRMTNSMSAPATGPCLPPAMICDASN